MDNTHVSSSEHFLHGRSAINDKATARATGEGASPHAHSEEMSNIMVQY